MSTSIALLILYLTGGVLSLSEELQELVDSLHRACVEETGASEDLISKAKKGDFSDDEKLECYMKCLLDQMGCIDENGIIDLDATIAILPDEYQEKGDRVIRACGTKIGKNPCDNAFLTNKCWFEHAPDDYFLA